MQTINNQRLWIKKNKFFIESINKRPDIENICLYSKNPSEAKYLFLNNKRESKDLKDLNFSEAFIEYSNNMDNV